MLGRIVDELARREGPRILAGLIGRFGGNFDLAEEALQDAYERALATWPVDGLPQRPGAWITTVAWRRGIDLLRRSRREVPDADTLLANLVAPDLEAIDDDELPDDRLHLLFTCCHPALAPQSQMALALRTLCGLATRDIARAFLEAETATAQRLVRAKRKIADAGIPYCVPESSERPARLATVLATIYLVFNEGYSAAFGQSLLRPDLCVEAIRLSRLVVELIPDEPEVMGLLALLRLQDARRAARVDGDGTPIPLEEQDRSRWDREAITEGIAFLDRAIELKRRGPYQVQAAIAALHGKAPSAQATDWTQISALYRSLHTMTPTAVVALNAAAALAMAAGPDAGLSWIDRIEAGGELEGYYLLPAARADLLRRAGRTAQALGSYRQALSLAGNASERLYLERRVRELQG